MQEKRNMKVNTIININDYVKIVEYEDGAIYYLFIDKKKLYL